MLNHVWEILLNTFSYFFLMTWMIWLRIKQKNLFIAIKYIDED
jgi:polyferredoxin